MAKNEVSMQERILKAFANKRRLAIVRYLKNQRDASVGDIAGAIKLSFKATSKHLGILVAADIVDREQRGPQMFYRLSQDASPFGRSIISLL